MNNIKNLWVSFVAKIKKIFASILVALKTVSVKWKLIVAAAIGVVGFLSVVFLRGNTNTKQSYKYKLAKVTHDLEVKRLEEKSDKNLQELNTLDKKKEVIKEQIAHIESKQLKGEDVTTEELDAFFDKRGF